MSSWLDVLLARCPPAAVVQSGLRVVVPVGRWAASSRKSTHHLLASLAGLNPLRHSTIPKVYCLLANPELRRLHSTHFAPPPSARCALPCSHDVPTRPSFYLYNITRVTALSRVRLAPVMMVHVVIVKRGYTSGFHWLHSPTKPTSRRQSCLSADPYTVPPTCVPSRRPRTVPPTCVPSYRPTEPYRTSQLRDTSTLGRFRPAAFHTTAHPFRQRPCLVPPSYLPRPSPQLG